MKQLVLGLISVVSVCGLFGGIASADTLSVSQTLTITARVAPARYVIINAGGIITAVLSNTNEAVTPEVRLGGVRGPAQKLTPGLQAQYQRIIATHTGSLIGTVYPGQPTKSAAILSMLTAKPAV